MINKIIVAIGGQKKDKNAPDRVTVPHQVKHCQLKTNHKNTYEYLKKHSSAYPKEERLQ